MPRALKHRENMRSRPAIIPSILSPSSPPHRSGTEDVVDFEFTTSAENSMQILKTWNIRLMESITFNPQQLNEISSVLNTNTLPSNSKHSKGRGIVSRSFRASKHNSVKEDTQDLRRADSFSKLQSYRTDISGGVVPGGLSQGNVRVGGLPPLPREANTRSWGGDDHLGPNGMLGALSQDSVFAHSTGLLGSPPPLPPRPNFRTKDYGNQDDSDDPDYAYIKEDEVEGPRNGNANGVKKHRPSISVDDELSRLEQDIIRDNRAKKEEERRRTMTLDQAPVRGRNHVPPLSLGPRVHFPKPHPQDYTEFVPAKRAHLKSTSSEPEKASVPASHTRSISEPDSRIQPSPARAGMQPAVSESNDEEMDSLLPRGQPLQSDHTPTDYSDFLPSNAPALPPRSWRNASTSSYTSLSSSGNLGNDLSGSVSSTVFAPINELGVALGRGVALTSDNLSDESGPDKPVSPDSQMSLEKKPVGQTTPSPNSDKENKVPPTTIPEETLPLATSTEAPQPEGGLATPPPLPPRSPAKEKLSRKSSTSSNSSASSNGRCPRCRSLRKSKASVSKTVSLDQRTATIAKEAHEECRKSLPDLADTTEDSLGGKGHRHAHRGREHSHCSRCSPVSSTNALQGDSPPSLKSTSLQNFDYLQLVGEDANSTSSIENELSVEMDLLNSCLQTLEYLENKVKATTSEGGTDTMTSAVSNSTHSHTHSTSASQWMPMTTGSKVRPAPHSDVKKSVYTQAKNQAEMALAELNQPLRSHGPKASRPSSYTATERHGHTPLGKQNSFSSFTPSTTIGLRGIPNGTLPVRSTSSTALIAPSIVHAPPIPPRSMVSLTETLAVDPNKVSRVSPKNKSHSAGQLHTQTLPINKQNRLISGGPNYRPPHHAPVRSATSIGITPSSTRATPSSTRGHPSLIRHQPMNHVEGPGQSSTVFIHHIKDRRVGGLTHLV